MRFKAQTVSRWLRRHPVAIINIGFILAAVGLFIFLLYKPIDVLVDWKIEITDVKTYRDGKAVYNPGDTLIFKSSSKKLVSTEGVTSRSIICEATATQQAREIQLDTLVAARPAGKNPSRDNAITLPDITQFDGLPRNCYLSFDVCYKDVILWRDYCEHNQTPAFIVEEEVLDANKLKQQIEELTAKIKSLQDQLIALGTAANSNGSSGSLSQTPQDQRVSVSSPKTGGSSSGGSNGSGGTNTPPPAQNQPGFVESVVNAVGKATVDTVNGISGLVQSVLK